MICLPIVGSSMPKALDQMTAAEKFADIIELRLDLIASFDLKILLNAANKPVIVTARSKLDGGQFKGSEEKRVALLHDALETGADYIDIEVSTQREYLQPFLESHDTSKIIISYHDFSHTPEDLTPLYETMKALPGEIIKIVTYARNLSDNLKMFKLLERAKKENKKLIGLCMGDLGEISRVLSPLYGGFLTFGSLERGQESAPGQIPANDLKNVYRVNDAHENFKVYGVIGNPVSKSMGYLIHNRAFREINSPDVYVSFLVENVEKFFIDFKNYFAGLSVTMPAKENIIKLLDRVDDTAQKIGAVNTIVQEDHKWVGYNTDFSGAIAALEACTSLKNKNILIIGSGGTAKAVGYGINKKGGRLTITYNRNKERAELLAKELNSNLIDCREVGNRPIDILINCSPVGMNPDINKTPFLARDLKKEMIVFDAVYNPIETRLLREAKAIGCKVIPGSELFVNQAARQFELWTGQTAPIDAMREVLMAKLSS